MRLVVTVAALGLMLVMRLGGRLDRKQRERSRRFAARVSTTAATWCDCGSSAVDRQNIASGRDGCFT